MDSKIDKQYDKKINQLLWNKFETVYKFSQTFKVMAWIIAVLSLVVSCVTLSYIWGYLCIVILLCILAIFIISAKKEQVVKSCPLIGYLYAMAIMLLNVDNLYEICFEKWDTNLVLCSIGCASLMIVGAYILLIVFSGILEKIIDIDLYDKKLFFKLLGNFEAFLFITMLFIPSESYFSNSSDFDIKFRFIVMFAVPYIVVVPYTLAAFLVNFKLRIADTAASLVCGINIAIYYQYMFGNSLLKSLDGSSIKWDDYSSKIYINLAVWIVLVSIPFVIKKCNKKAGNSLVLAVPVFLLGIHLISLVAIAIPGLQQENKYYDAYLSGEEEFVVSPAGNVVVFVIDACDNDDIKDIYENEPEVFDDFSDFTMYTNTCSVYDASMTSIMTMMAGAEFNSELSAEDWYHEAWNTPKTKEFYGRLHDNNYKINYFNFWGNPVEWVGRIDNAIPVDIPKYSAFKTKEYKENMTALSAYRVMPYIVKKHIDMSEISFFDLIVLGKYNSTKYYNNEFENACELKLSDSEQPYLKYHHIRGTHDPCENYYEETKHCLRIANKYFSQMRELGVYDDATIILTADHGRHDSWGDNEFASTPMFMIKEPHTTHKSIVKNNAPIYHEDIVPTILQNVGLYDEKNKEDVDVLGTSIYMHSEGEKRRRVWYNRSYIEDYSAKKSKFLTFSADYNCYNMYVYYGDEEDLKRTVKEKRVEHVYKIYDFFG